MTSRLADQTATGTVYPQAAPQGVSPQRTHIILVECIDASDVLLRVLGMATIQQAHLVSVTFKADHGKAEVRLEVTGLSSARAAHLCQRMQQSPLVTSTALGWRAME